MDINSSITGSCSSPTSPSITICASQENIEQKYDDDKINKTKPGLSKCFPQLNVFKYLLVEPVCLLQGIANSSLAVIMQSFYIDRICRISHNFPTNLCMNLTSFPNEEKLVESTVSTFTTYISLIESGFPILLSLFMGPWMDKYGEKRILLLSLAGWIISTLIRIAFTMFPNLPPAFIMISSLPIAFSGGNSTFVISAFSLMSNKTSLKSRSFRISFLGIIWDLGSPIGLILGDKIFQYGGFLATFSTATIIYLLSYIYALIMIPTVDNELAIIQDTESRNSCSRVFNFGAICETFQTYFRRRSGAQRCCLLLLTCCVCLNIANYVGAGNFRFLYTRNKFGWDIETYSYYSAINTLLGIIGANILIFTTLKLFQLPDIAIILFSCTSSIAGNLIFSIGNSSWEMYLGAVVQMFSGVINVLSRALISKFIPKDEYGKIFTVVTCFEASIPFLVTPIFSIVYTLSLSSFPGTIFIISAGVVLVAVFNFIYVYFTMRNFEETTLLSEVN